MAVRQDGVHTEMLQADPETCTEILTSWWATMGRLVIFAGQWREAILCPLCKKGRQDEPANYRPVSIISHMRKLIDAAILTSVCESFTPARAQFRFQAVISVQQAQRQAQTNAQNVLKHASALDLAKAYDTVDRTKLLRPSELGRREYNENDQRDAGTIES